MYLNVNKLSWSRFLYLISLFIFLLYSQITNAQFVLKSVSPNSALPGSDVTLRVTGGSSVQFARDCSCSQTLPRCVNLNCGSFIMSMFDCVNFSPYTSTGYINAVANITVENGKPNYFDISFKVPSDQKLGWYDLTVTPKNGSTYCILVLRSALLIGASNSIHQIPNNNLLVFPNPANDNIQIAFKEFSPIIIEIYNCTNQLVMKKLLNNEDDRIRVSELSRGVYEVHFVRNQETIGVQKLILN